TAVLPPTADYAGWNMPASASDPPKVPSRGRAPSLYEDMLDRMTDQVVRWRSMAVLFFAGGLLADLSTLLPTGDRAILWALLALGTSAMVSAIVMFVLAARLPEWLMSYVLAFGTMLVTFGVVATRDTGAVYALFYVWVGFEAFFFLSRRHALAHMAFVAIAYAAALALAGGDAPDAAARWLMTIGTVVMVGLLAGVLQDRAERLIDRLADAARTDALTGLLNRRGFEELIDSELERARRSGLPLTVVVGDLDHFKSINDRFGHRVGDRTLQRFGAVAGGVKRRIDDLARIGGEEFALVLPDTDEHGGFLLAERLRRAVRDDGLADDAAVTVSFGVASWPRHAATPEQLLHCADQALYLAKQLGRDRSVIFSEEVAGSLAGGAAEEGPQAVEQVAAVLILAETLDLRDSGTAQHSQTVGRLCEQIGIALGLDDARVERLRLAGLLHDLGKIGIPDHVLGKAGALTEAEWAEMRKHPELGARILSGANLDDISAWVLAHHERPDGRGYPYGLAGEAIPLEARVLAVADSYEAMTSDRVYRRGMPREEAIAELERCAGSQFDERVVAAFVASLMAVPER
ncbi:MAG TPA: diguanylate cyclase, partial [Solirubrobacteraceae bacterium]|nr:diguanylate cyclase [Solirubrobacteraceae bacterium]